MNNSFTKEEINTLQNISIEITNMALELENIKNIMKNYLFVDCGEKLNPNIVLNECYEQSLNISYEELEEITYKLDTICFRGNTDCNTAISASVSTSRWSTDTALRATLTSMPPRLLNWLVWIFALSP